MQTLATRLLSSWDLLTRSWPTSPSKIAHPSDIQPILGYNYSLSKILSAISTPLFSTIETHIRNLHSLRGRYSAQIKDAVDDQGKEESDGFALRTENPYHLLRPLSSLNAHDGCDMAPEESLSSSIPYTLDLCSSVGTTSTAYRFRSLMPDPDSSGRPCSVRYSNISSWRISRKARGNTWVR